MPTNKNWLYPYFGILNINNHIKGPRDTRADFANLSPILALVNLFHIVLAGVVCIDDNEALCRG